MKNLFGLIMAIALVMGSANVMAQDNTKKEGCCKTKTEATANKKECTGEKKEGCKKDADKKECAKGEKKECCKKGEQTAKK
ncbi:MAG: hypothetical protein LBS07_01085 [Prevotellaceae bacterium]|jgi:hypothetical protein|nr:hypothetical protein [Prevotellaceae bacterium]